MPTEGGEGTLFIKRAISSRGGGNEEEGGKQLPVLFLFSTLLMIGLLLRRVPPGRLAD